MRRQNVPPAEKPAQENNYENWDNCVDDIEHKNIYDYLNNPAKNAKRN